MSLHCFPLSFLRSLLLPVLLVASLPVRSAEPGFASYSVQGNSVAGETRSVSISFQAGTDLGPGAALQLTRPWHDGRRFSIADKGPDRVSVRAGRSDVILSLEEASPDAAHGRLIPASSAVLIRVEAGTLQAGDRVSIAVDEVQLPAKATAEFEFPLYLISSEKSRPVRVPAETLAIRSGPVAQLAVSAHSIVKPGEDVNLRVRLEDRYGNLAPEGQMSLDLLVNGTFRSRIALTSSLQAVEGVSFSVPGIYEIEVRSGGGGLRGLSNPVKVDAAARERVLWLGLGEHTRASDGLRSREEIERAGAGRYDLVIPSDHAPATPVPGSQASLSMYELETGEPHPGLGELAEGDTVRTRLALPEQPTDLRFVSPAQLNLAGILAGGSIHTWLIDRLGERGMAPGVVALNHSHQYPVQTPDIYTGLLVRDGQTAMDALVAGQSFVSRGGKVVLMIDAPGSLPLTGEKRFPVEVIAGSSLRRIEMYRNGELHQVREGEARESDGDEVSFRLSVASESRPFGQLFSQPRNGREWIGYLRTRDAAISRRGARQPGWQLYQGSDMKRLDFLTWTHGSEQSIELVLDRPTADTVLELGLASGIEDAAWLPADRIPAEVPGQRFLVSYAELETGARRVVDVDGYRDVLTFEMSHAGLSSPATVVFQDNKPSRLGDFYYFRVLLEDGSLAYSSVFMVDRIGIGD